jgi:hypothetical protein
MRHCALREALKFFFPAKFEIEDKRLGHNMQVEFGLCIILKVRK